VHSIADLACLLRNKRFVVLTGAGCSTESGIPDYRGPETRRRARAPMQGRTFIGSEDARRRYWARAVVGWERFRNAQPNAAHRALASLEERGLVSALLTQNVDSLHRAAGSRRVIELHGALADVICLSCDAREDRASVQRRLLERNPGYLGVVAELAPDGDAELPDALIEDFRVVACERCDGVLKPRVVFFGESVPRPVVDAAFAELDAADALVVVGSSLAVFSGYRFVLRAAQRGIPSALVNLGEARGHELFALRIASKAGAAMSELLDRLASTE
jgi:NAD-dependent SIR2 family protein deacetylase